MLWRWLTTQFSSILVYTRKYFPFIVSFLLLIRLGRSPKLTVHTVCLFSYKFPTPDKLSLVVARISFGYIFRPAISMSPQINGPFYIKNTLFFHPLCGGFRCMWLSLLQKSDSWNSFTPITFFRWHKLQILLSTYLSFFNFTLMMKCGGCLFYCLLMIVPRK